MAKILIEGKKDKVTCHRCGSYLQFFDSDIKLAKLPHGSFDYDDADEEDRYRAYIRCPSCRTDITVDAASGLKKERLEYERRMEMLRDHDI